MKKILFPDKSRLHDAIRQNADPVDEQSDYPDLVERIHERLWELYGPKLVLARNMAITAFIEGISPQQKISKEKAPVAVFKRSGRVWEANAVFYVADKIDRERFELFSNVGIEMVPLPVDYVSGGMLKSKDFRFRSKRAVFVPTEQPFRKIPDLKPENKKGNK